MASFSSGAEAQQSNLPPVTVDAPVARPRPAASKPTPDQVRARNALRRAAQRQQAAQQAAGAVPERRRPSADRNPYADAAAPYKVDHVQASGKFPEPMLNTPKTITVLSKEVLEDKNATTLKQAVLSTAGVTLGIGRGRQRLRRPLLHPRLRRPQRRLHRRHPRSRRQRPRKLLHRAGRDPARPGLVLCRPRHRRRRDQHRHQAGDDGESFYNMDTDVRHRPDQARHARRQPGDQPDAGGARRRPVPGRQCRRPRLRHRRSRWRFRRGDLDSRSTTSRSRELLHTDLTACPDFGVPYYRPKHGQRHGRWTVPGLRRQPQNFYGFVNRDFFKAGRTSARSTPSQDHARPDAEQQDPGDRARC